MTLSPAARRFAAASLTPRPLLFLGIAAFALVAGFSVGEMRAVSAAPPASYSVQAGDSLYAIAIKFAVSEDDRADWIKAVMRLNGLPSADVVQVGQVLTLPPSAAAPAPAAPVSGATGSTSAVTSANSVSYTVQPADTLAAISARLAVPESERDRWLAGVVSLNSLAGPDLLVAGQTLTLPALNGATVTRADPVAGSAPAAGAPASAYTVQPGDSLAAIAANLGIAEPDRHDWLAAVVQLSGLENANVLAAGQSLRLPGAAATWRQAGSARGAASAPVQPTVTYTVRTGDTLGSIASKQGVADADLVAWLAAAVQLSRLSDGDLLSVGQTLTVPAPPAQSPSPVPATNTRTAPATSASQPVASGLTYMVRPGDMLSGIAATLGIDDSDQGKWAAAVVKLNSLTNPDILMTGQVLALPVSPAPVAAAVDTSAFPTSMALPPAAGVQAPQSFLSPGASPPGLNSQPAVTPLFGGGRFYTVQKGDTLQTIAQKVGVPPDKLSFWMAEVAALNAISPDALPVGDGLRLP
jgi:LysM repeat protein